MVTGKLFHAVGPAATEKKTVAYSRFFFLFAADTLAYQEFRLHSFNIRLFDGIIASQLTEMHLDLQ